MGLLLGTAACTLPLMPLSCGDDTTASSEDASGTDGTTDSSQPDTSSKDGTADAKNDTTTEAGGEAATEAASETGSGADADAGPSQADADADAGDVVAVEDADASADGDGGPQCGAPTDPAMARACLVITGTDQVNPVALADGAAVTDLDNMGTLLIYAFGVPNPADGGPDGGAATPIAQPIAIPPPNDAGLFTMEMPVGALTSLQPIPIDVPVTTAYILTYFIDNPAGFQALKQNTLTYGMFVGGLDLTQGIQPVPPVRSVTLTAGQGTIVKQYLTVLRKFDSVVVRAPVLPDGGLLPPAAGGDGTGTLLVGAYRQAPVGTTQVFGGALYPCVDIIREAPYPVTGFFYTPTGGGDTWFTGDLNDFGDQTTAPPKGSMVSVALDDAGVQVIPDTQKVTVGTSDYAVTIPFIALTAATQPPSGSDLLNCPFLPPDASTDASGDAPTDATGN